MSTVPAESDGPSDAELITSVRTGTIAAYGTLYERHVHAAYNLARQLARSQAAADDLVSEAFAKVLDTLRAGKGPDAAFRAYLLTALRHTAYDKTRKDRKIDLNEDMAEVGGTAGEALTVQFSDTAVAGLERTMAAKAFTKLPERWQAVLWHTEIEGQSPAEVAPLLGLTANGVSALAYRAREGLRQAYLQVHLAETTAERCRATADRLGAWTRDGLSKRERTQVELHLDECARCRALAAELADVNGALRAIIAPMVLGGAVLAYLATAGAAKASAATAGLAAVGAGAAAGAAGSSGSGGAAGAAAAVPRQLLGVAGSGAAVAAAIVVGLLSSGSQEIPAAISQPEPVVSAPAPVAPKPVVPPAPPVSPPAPPPAPTTPPPAPTPAPPVPEPAKMSAQTPPQGIELSSDGKPVDLPITIRNDGGSVSEPVVVSLALPKGVRAVSTGGGGGSPAGATSPRIAARTDAPLAVACPAGEGTVTCKTERGLQPGESAILTYRLVADQTAQPGVVTGSVSSGSLVQVSVAVNLKVAPSPDQLSLRVRTLWSTAFPGVRAAWVSVDITNDGPEAKPVTITMDRPGRLTLGHSRAKCEISGTTTCVSLVPLKPKEHLRIWLEVDNRPDPGSSVTVAAKLGSANKSQQAVFDCWWRECAYPEVPVLPGSSVLTSPPTSTTTTPNTPLAPTSGQHPPAAPSTTAPKSTGNSSPNPTGPSANSTNPTSATTTGPVTSTTTGPTTSTAPPTTPSLILTTPSRPWWMPPLF